VRGVVGVGEAVRRAAPDSARQYPSDRVGQALIEGQSRG
jgi:hypothetical protein